MSEFCTSKDRNLGLITSINFDDLMHIMIEVDHRIWYDIGTYKDFYILLKSCIGEDNIYNGSDKHPTLIQKYRLVIDIKTPASKLNCEERAKFFRFMEPKNDHSK